MSATTICNKTKLAKDFICINPECILDLASNDCLQCLESTHRAGKHTILKKVTFEERQQEENLRLRQLTPSWLETLSGYVMKLSKLFQDMKLLFTRFIEQTEHNVSKGFNSLIFKYTDLDRLLQQGKSLKELYLFKTHATIDAGSQEQCYQNSKQQFAEAVKCLNSTSLLLKTNLLKSIPKPLQDPPPLNRCFHEDPEKYLCIKPSCLAGYLEENSLNFLCKTCLVEKHCIGEHSEFYRQKGYVDYVITKGNYSALQTEFSNSSHQFREAKIQLAEQICSLFDQLNNQFDRFVDCTMDYETRVTRLFSEELNIRLNGSDSSRIHYQEVIGQYREAAARIIRDGKISPPQPVREVQVKQEFHGLGEFTPGLISSQAQKVLNDELLAKEQALQEEKRVVRRQFIVANVGKIFQNYPISKLKEINFELLWDHTKGVTNHQFAELIRSKLTGNGALLCMGGYDLNNPSVLTLCAIDEATEFVNAKILDETKAIKSKNGNIYWYWNEGLSFGFSPTPKIALMKDLYEGEDIEMIQGQERFSISMSSKGSFRQGQRRPLQSQSQFHYVIYTSKQSEI